MVQLLIGRRDLLCLFFSVLLLLRWVTIEKQKRECWNNNARKCISRNNSRFAYDAVN